MFDFFKKKQVYMCIPMMQYLHFSSKCTLEPCCCANQGPVFLENLKTQKSIITFITNKNKYIELLKKGIIPQNCKNCINIKPYTSSIDKKITKIYLNHFQDCDCACIYCSQKHNSFSLDIDFKGKEYDVIPFINDLYDNSLINTEKLIVEIQGGNISCLKNRNELIQLFINRGVNIFYIYSNNIMFLPELYELFENKKAFLITSLDSGCAETFKRIKQVDKFNACIENLKKYSQVALPGYIVVKYIILNGYNDNIDEINKFFNVMHEANIKSINFDIDFGDISRDEKYTIPDYYYDLIEHAKNEASNLNMNFFIPPYTMSVLKRGYSLPSHR